MIGNPAAGYSELTIRLSPVWADGWFLRARVEYIEVDLSLEYKVRAGIDLDTPPTRIRGPIYLDLQPPHTPSIPLTGAEFAFLGMVLPLLTTWHGKDVS